MWFLFSPKGGLFKGESAAAAWRLWSDLLAGLSVPSDVPSGFDARVKGYGIRGPLDYPDNLPPTGLPPKPTPEKK